MEVLIMGFGLLLVIVLSIVDWKSIFSNKIALA